MNRLRFSLVLIAFCVLGTAACLPALTAPTPFPPSPLPTASAPVPNTSVPPISVPSTAAPNIDAMPPTASYDLLVSALRDAGHTVDEVGPTQGSMFSGDGHIIKLDGQEVQIFQYPTPADTEAEAARISSDGGQFTGANGVVASVDWMDVPHFFKNGLVMVVYVGRDTATTGALEAVLGPQFAGG